MKPLWFQLTLTLIGFLILTIVPLPDLLAPCKPPFIAIIILYIQFFLPRYFRFILLFILGFCLDVLLHTLLGEHAFALILVSWMASTKARRIHFFTMGQQMGMIGLFCFIYQSIFLTVDIFLGFHYVVWMPFASAGVAMLVWPWIRILLDDFFSLKLSIR